MRGRSYILQDHWQNRKAGRGREISYHIRTNLRMDEAKRSSICDDITEMLYKLWKQYGHIDEWRTANCWRVLCELYAKLIGLLLQHWLMLLFAWHDEQRSLVKLAQVVRDMAGSLMEALTGHRSLRSALRTIQLRMGSGTQMNKRRKHPNSAQLLQQGFPNWELSP